MPKGIVVKIWNVSSGSGKRSSSKQISDSIDYIFNKEKCSEKLDDDLPFQLGRELKYVTNDVKTLEGLYVGGRHILDIENAANEMLQIKEYYGKLDGRAALHGTISLDALESDKQNAGKLMLLCDELMREIFVDHQAVYAVHTNTEHLHVHFVINTVGMGGKKIHMDNEFMKKVFQPAINRLAAKYGFTENEQWKKENKKDVLPIVERKMMLRKLIDLAIEETEDFGSFVKYLSMEGVTVNVKSEVYDVDSIYFEPRMNELFLQLKANVCDLNPALITKCITGTEQDFIMLMNRAASHINERLVGVNEEEKKQLLEMFRQCVFGYYILTPLIESKEVSDIKVLDYDHIVVKANGERYVTNCRFFDEADYKSWFDRILRIHRLGRSDENALGHCTDRKGVKDFYLRIDVQLPCVTSTEKNNIHIRKMPKTKLSWEYLKENQMLDDEMMEYLQDRIGAGYGFLISGRGGSGKSTLLNNMIDLIPYNQSILVSQESDELYSNEHPQIQFEHTMTVKKAEYEKEFSLEDELRLGLLQDIDNFIIGEIKGGEALYVFTTAMSTGARFFGTIHSNDAASSVTRLSQCARYISDYPMETLEEMLTVMPFVLIHMSHFSIDEILEVDGWDEKTRRLKFREVYRKEVQV